MRKTLLIVIAMLLGVIVWFVLGIRAEMQTMQLERRQSKQQQDSINIVTRQQQIRQNCAEFIRNAPSNAKEFNETVAKQRKNHAMRTDIEEYAEQLIWARNRLAEGRTLLRSDCGQDSAFLYQFNKFSAIVIPVLESEDRQENHNSFKTAIGLTR